MAYGEDRAYDRALGNTRLPPEPKEGEMLQFALKSLLALTLISGIAAQEPIGTVAAWHPDLSGTPTLPAACGAPVATTSRSD